MNKYLYFIFPFFTLLFYYCSSDSNNDEVLLDAPALLSSTPANGSTDIANGDLSIVLTMDQNVTCPSSGYSLITLDGATITNITANLTKITIQASGLEEGTSYSLIIPSGVILGPTKVGNKEINISFSTREPVTIDITTSLVTENPLTQTQNVYDFLVKNYGSKVLSATMANVSWNINEAEWVNYHTGKYPAITTFDYIHLDYSPANWIDYNDITAIEDWWNNNGIVSAGWHWNVPVTENSTTNSFYSDNNSFSAADALIDGTWENTVINADLEEMADYLLLVQNKNIPIIWRPLHEAAGNIYEYNGGTAWFWWGSDGAEAYKNLWIYMFNYFKNKGINNLIWVWTTQSGDDEFYPGDDYVDIIGRDIYGESSAANIAAQFTSIQESYPDKIITLSECGNVATISEQWTSGAKWSYYMPWYDYDRTNDTSGSEFTSAEHGSANADWWINAFNNENVITRDEIPDLN